jgi:hypothetical protein
MMDATREWRTGVTRQGQGVDPKALQNQVATIANQQDTAARAKCKLIARIFAETGIRDLFSLLHAEIREHGGQAETVQLRNTWVTVNPRQFKSRDDMTINVGLGSGTREQDLVSLQLLIGAQKEAIQLGLVTKGNLYNSAKELVRLSGRKDPSVFFTAPPEGEDEAPIQPPEDPKMAEMQMKAEIEKLQAQADMQTQQQKTAAEMALAERKFELDREMKMLEMAMRREEHQLEMQAKQQANAIDLEAKQQQHAFNMAAGAQKHQAGLEQSGEKHEVGLEQMKQKAEAKPEARP